ncbi:unnamed protein product [Alternaria alternata]
MARHTKTYASNGGSSTERSAKKTTRRKRDREDEDADEEIADNSPLPPKKAATAKAKASKAKPSPDTSAPKSKTNPPPAPSSPTNRDANGAQEVYWLLKAEPLPRYENGVNVAFSISDLRACTEPEPWGGVRNPQARNNMQAMRKGDLGFFYPLQCQALWYFDETAFDPKDPYYDKKSVRENPKWYCVGVEFVREFDDIVDLARIKEYAKEGPLRDMQLVTNSRLSVNRVRKEEWEFIMELVDGANKNDKTE